MATKGNKNRDKREPRRSLQNSEKNYYFIAGLPRSGSTLLCNILAQNLRFYVEGTSGIMDIIFGIRNTWDQHLEFKARPNEPAKHRVMRGILESFYSDVDRPVVFDKCRGWLSLLEMAESILGHKAKVLVPVRDMRDDTGGRIAPAMPPYLDPTAVSVESRKWTTVELMVDSGIR